MLKFLFRDMWKSFKRTTKNDIIAIISFIVIITILLIANFKGVTDEPHIVLMVFFGVAGVFGYGHTLADLFNGSNVTDHKRVLLYIIGFITMCVLFYTAI